MRLLLFFMFLFLFLPCCAVKKKEKNPNEKTFWLPKLATAVGPVEFSLKLERIVVKADPACHCGEKKPTADPQK